MSDSTKDKTSAPAEQRKQNGELDQKQLDNVSGGYGALGGGGGAGKLPREGLLPAV
ncbi:hypothetical protein G8O24_06790 [Bradyrhizobium sp. INPA01-394B]|uniref:Bacteriocin n=1 Tax=Bradyrhizobium campsiandrae TaxID=1729892 RepID=A0ABR7UHC0_9BRAD|nr:hypothetical protein [Bradyrhizobium campsiandrae]MBC9876889.1 hypothetical protein [Bradyrhizobium campsiandrae]MBC9877049.1 hypothetical protein [Bradyrhizobium campsiandrae]MBC9983283.1 hypothetical protein [Bradyrhizobium campsiandrae]